VSSMSPRHFQDVLYHFMTEPTDVYLRTCCMYFLQALLHDSDSFIPKIVLKNSDSENGVASFAQCLIPLYMKAFKKLEIPEREEDWDSVHTDTLACMERLTNILTFPHEKNSVEAIAVRIIKGKIPFESINEDQAAAFGQVIDKEKEVEWFLMKTCRLLKFGNHPALVQHGLCISSHLFGLADSGDSLLEDEKPNEFMYKLGLGKCNLLATYMYWIQMCNPKQHPGWKKHMAVIFARKQILSGVVSWLRSNQIEFIMAFLSQPTPVLEINFADFYGLESTTQKVENDQKMQHLSAAENLKPHSSSPISHPIKPKVSNRQVDWSKVSTLKEVSPLETLMRYYQDFYADEVYQSDYLKIFYSIANPNVPEGVNVFYAVKSGLFQETVQVFHHRSLFDSLRTEGEFLQGVLTFLELCEKWEKAPEQPFLRHMVSALKTSNFMGYQNLLLRQREHNDSREMDPERLQAIPKLLDLAENIENYMSKVLSVWDEDTIRATRKGPDNTSQHQTEILKTFGNFFPPTNSRRG